MEGYSRLPAMTSDLGLAITEALETHSNERLGQLIVNALRRDGEPGPTSDQLWNLHDEVLLDKIHAYLEKHHAQ